MNILRRMERLLLLRLSIAKYVARELVKPAGYVTNEEAVNFDTKYQGQDVKTAVYNSEYKNTPTTFEFTKIDITSGAELTGATLTVLDKDGNVVDTWTSDAKEAHINQETCSWRDLHSS